MTKDEKLNEFLERTGIELLPFQKEILKQMTDENKIYICYPPNVGRTNTLLLMRALGNVFEKEKTMCSFCEKIYHLGKDGLPDENLISYDTALDQFDIWSATGDPYDSGVIGDVKYCPYCGRELKKGENENAET